MRKVLLALVPASVLLVSGASAAMTISYTEGRRSEEVSEGATGFLVQPRDAGGANNPFDLTQEFDDGALSDGDRVEVHGRIVGATDAFIVTSEVDFSLEVLDVTPDDNKEHTVQFSLTRIDDGSSDGSDPSAATEPSLASATTAPTTFVVQAETDDPNDVDSTLIPIIAAGQYQLIVDMVPDNGAALYDIAFQATSFPDLDVDAVPLPAALPLFAAGLGLLGGLRRRRG